MKAIELTEEHKSKLLEMCKVLFPEYDKLSISDCQIDVHKSVTMIGLFKENKNFNDTLLGFPNEGSHIHWFEFCITTLATKIWNESSQIRQKWGTITMFRGVLCQVVDHPIDYLYEQFKKL